ncbi:MAG TPA: hypothetical protein VFY23_01615 [Candidatus Limnocylindrales bacterium]|nr:hypothetical protein [Candidatus Limnocylindrales bacterium]
MRSRVTSIVVAASSVVLALVVATPAAAHVPGVVPAGNESPATAHVLEDPTLSRALGATLGAPGEMDWYRMDLRAGDALVVEVTAPDGAGGIPVGFTLLGPALEPPASAEADALAAAVDAQGAYEHEPEGGAREVHGGLGFIAWGGLRTTAPADGTYWVAVRAAEDGATGKYVLAPGVREEFGPGAVGGMADLVTFFNAPWPPAEGATPAAATAGADDTVVTVVLVIAGLAIGGILATAMRRRRPATPAAETAAADPTDSDAPG